MIGSAVSFALAHSAAAINPDQSPAASLRQIVFDLLGFVGVRADPIVGDIAVIVAAAVVAATLIKLGQGGSLPRSRS